MFGCTMATRVSGTGRASCSRAAPQMTGSPMAAAARRPHPIRGAQWRARIEAAISAFTATIQKVMPCAPATEAPWIQAGRSARA